MASGISHCKVIKGDLRRGLDRVFRSIVLLLFGKGLFSSEVGERSWKKKKILRLWKSHTGSLGLAINPR